jgi:cyclopropane-fatty-acyl-phospholipid synthase
VYKKPVASSEFTIRTPPTIFEKWCMNQITAFFLKKLQSDSIELLLPDRSRLILGAPQVTPQYSIVVRDYRFFSRLLLSGDIGLGESYTNGEWDADDIPGFMTLFIRHFVKFEKQTFFLSTLFYLYHRLLNYWRKNSITGSRKNIQAHYDLSNEMFQQFLDETMTYSCAVFQSPEQSLTEAQRNKLQKIIQKARIEPHHHVLEIGTGWGSFAIEVVRQTGCRVTTVTISKAQFQLAQEHVAQAGLEDNIEIKLCDYRLLEGRYDRLISIEMIEAVGHKYLPEYFKTCERLLKPNGIMVLQVITVLDQLYDRFRIGFDWTRKHIFPGGHLPSLQAMSNILTNHTQFMIENLENIGPHYIQTLAQWQQNFLEAEQNIRALGFDEEFCRKWNFYFGLCQAAFSTGYLNDLQLVLTRPGEFTRPDEFIRPGESVKINTYRHTLHENSRRI